LSQINAVHRVIIQPTTSLKLQTIKDFWFWLDVSSSPLADNTWTSQNCWIHTFRLQPDENNVNCNPTGTSQGFGLISFVVGWWLLVVSC